ncbi:MAG: type VI secretion system tube protein Hcp [Planctomycetaceae bacterium]|nr:type VI secretion system tube protein Hcp [Planctomycetaceae bacterium]
MLPIGNKEHFPVTIIKKVDRSTPNLATAFRTGEPLTIVINFYEIDSTGAEINRYRMTFADAVISGIRREILNTKDQDNNTFPFLEKISFTYQVVTELWLPTGAGCKIEWEADCTAPLTGDLNFDGVVNLTDFVLMANDWLMSD